MKQITVAAGFFALLLVFAPVAYSEDKTVYLTSLEWPPYTGANLADQGASLVVAKAAFKAEGYNLVVEFYPWSRAIFLAKTDAKYKGYFPEYYSADNAKKFIYSAPMGSGPLGFAERADKHIVWNNMDDLAQYKVGVVQDYLNSEDFDRAVAEKKISVDVSRNDEVNLRKLSVGRIDLAVVDKNVFEYLLGHSPELAGAKDVLRFNDKFLEEKKLFVCFVKTRDGEKIWKIFNDGLKKINPDGLMAEYFKTRTQ